MLAGPVTTKPRLTGLCMTSKMSLVVTRTPSRELPPSSRETDMIVLLADGPGISARRAGPIDRLRRGLRASRLDALLAEGVAPESNLALALHAERLARTSERRHLAGSLKRIGSNPPRTELLRSAIGRRISPDASRDLEELADRLLVPGPVDVQGVAKIRMLLADGTGPLYRGGTARDLHAEVRDALVAVDPLD